ncbi:MAG: hypothetical protein M3365_03065 [Gemmatimonadota bacterium]|nr:hypothetical protein [Gemmatimonadota bacterium]
MGLAVAVSSCAPPAPVPPPRPAGPPTDTLRIPLNDLASRTYFGHVGGLYPGGVNLPPAAHDTAARARRNAIRPLDVNGDEDPFGKYVLISIGMSNTTQEWCSASSAPPCASWSLMGRASMDPTVNHTALVIVNGAADSQDAAMWTSPTSPTYERIRTTRLNPLGLSENQVQIAWVKLATASPVAALPSDTADAHIFLSTLGQALRTLKIRYPNLQLVFLSSRTYGGYAAIDLSPEPYAYEEGLSVKWAIESQMNEVRGLPMNQRAGSLDYTKKTAPLLLWGPYLWADGITPRSDGLTWLRTDFEDDGTQPSQAGETKTAASLLEFFKTSPYTRCWFLANQYCL